MDLGIKWGLCKPRPSSDANATNEIQSELRNGSTVVLGNTINMNPSARDIERCSVSRQENSTSINQNANHPRSRPLSHSVSETSFRHNAIVKENENIQMNSISVYTISDKTIFASNANSSVDSIM